MSEDPAASQLERLTALATSLLASPIDPNTPQPRLFPAKIPEDLPVEIPVPTQTRLLGSLARSDSHFVIMLESELPLDEVLPLLRTQLAILGWSEFEYMRQPMTGGFVQSEYRPSAQLALCHTPSRACLRPMLTERENATTVVRLDLTLGEQGNPCAHREQPRPHGVPGYPHHPTGEMLPTLIAPPGVYVGGSRSEAGATGMQTSAPVTTQLDQEVVAHHYADQLAHAGWTQTGAGTGGPFVWSTWQFIGTDPEPTRWSGLFFMLNAPDEPEHYTLHLKAYRPKTEPSQQSLSQ